MVSIQKLIFSPNCWRALWSCDSLSNIISWKRGNQRVTRWVCLTYSCGVTHRFCCLCSRRAKKQSNSLLCRETSSREKQQIVNNPEPLNVTSKLREPVSDMHTHYITCKRKIISKRHNVDESLSLIERDVKRQSFTLNRKNIWIREVKREKLNKYPDSYACEGSLSVNVWSVSYYIPLCQETDFCFTFYVSEQLEYVAWV